MRIPAMGLRWLSKKSQEGPWCPITVERPYSPALWTSFIWGNQIYILSHWYFTSKLKLDTGFKAFHDLTFVNLTSPFICSNSTIQSSWMFFSSSGLFFPFKVFPSCSFCLGYSPTWLTPTHPLHPSLKTSSSTTIKARLRCPFSGNRTVPQHATYYAVNCGVYLTFSSMKAGSLSCSKLYSKSAANSK